MNIIEFRNAIRKRQEDYIQHLQDAHTLFFIDIGEIVQKFIGNADVVERDEMQAVAKPDRY